MNNKKINLPLAQLGIVLLYSSLFFLPFQAGALEQAVSENLTLLRGAESVITVVPQLSLTEVEKLQPAQRDYNDEYFEIPRQITSFQKPVKYSPEAKRDPLLDIQQRKSEKMQRIRIDRERTAIHDLSLFR